MAGLEEALSSLGSGSAVQVAGSAVSGKPEDYVNNLAVEQMWAIKAVKYAETHFKLLQSRDASTLRLTKIDQEIHEKYSVTFKDLKIDVLDPDAIKTSDAKEVWREFCNHFEHKVHDFNFATLLRLDTSKDYSEENTIVAPRVQFLAIEIARNRTGLNSLHFHSPAV